MNKSFSEIIYQNWVCTNISISSKDDLKIEYLKFICSTLTNLGNCQTRCICMRMDMNNDLSRNSCYHKPTFLQLTTTRFKLALSSMNNPWFPFQDGCLVVFRNVVHVWRRSTKMYTDNSCLLYCFRMFYRVSRIKVIISGDVYGDEKNSRIEEPIWKRSVT